MNLQPKKNNLDTYISKLLLILTVLVTIGLIVFVSVSLYFLSPPDSSNDTMEEFLVEPGWSKIKIADELDKKGLIRNAFFFKFYMKINEKEMYAGTYKLSKSMTVDEIIRVLNSANSLENETVTVTFIEGRRFPDYVKKISNTFNISEEEIFSKLSNEEYLKSLIDQYWFLTNDILNPDVYYPLEGFLFADTYIIKKSATIEEIIAKMLSTMENKLSIYEEEILVSDYNIYQLITLASIVELEGAGSDDRAGVAGVFYNRLEINEALGSDVTTYYAAKKDFSKDLTKSELNDCNPYNTRGSCVPGLPVGPIASPSLASINATLLPTDHEFLFFVADKNKKTYFTKTLPEHNSEVARLKKEGLWFEY